MYLILLYWDTIAEVWQGFAQIFKKDIPDRIRAWLVL